MAEKGKNLVVVIRCGLDNECSAIAWNIINTSIESGVKVTIYLTDSAVNWARQDAESLLHENPQYSSFKKIIERLNDNGNEIYVFPKSSTIYGSRQTYIDGVHISRSIEVEVHNRIKEGASTLRF